MLLSLLQSPVTEPESEALARKVSCKPSLRRAQEVSVGLGLGWAGAEEGLRRHHRAAWLGGKWGPSPHCSPSQGTHLGTPFPTSYKGSLRARGGRSSVPKKDAPSLKCVGNSLSCRGRPQLSRFPPWAPVLSLFPWPVPNMQTSHG